MAKASSQEKFAQLVGITQPAVSQLIRKGVLTRGASIGQWHREYLENLRKLAAGFKSDYIDLDLIKERARLAARQSEKLEIELAEKRHDLVPIAAIASALNFLNGTIRSKLLAFPSRMKSLCPELTTRELTRATDLIHEVLTELSHERFPPNIRDIARQYFSDLHATASDNGKRVGGSKPISKP